jgi:uncharacterized membrane protein
MEKNKQKADSCEHPIVKHKLTFGQHSADRLTSLMGSWSFILIFFIFLGIWMVFNIFAWVDRWDPYPFILLNLCLSCLASIQAPIILMSQKRQEQRDRLFARYDYAVNRKAEREIQDMQKDLEEIKNMLLKKD